MRFQYCPLCGSKLIVKNLHDDENVKYCNTCNKPYFDSFNTCVIVLALNEDNEVCVIKQSYGDTQKNVLIAGFINIFERAEDACIREVQEEIAHEVLEVEYINSYPQITKDNLMLGYLCRVKKSKFKLSKELLEARYVKLDEALTILDNVKIAKELVKDYLLKKKLIVRQYQEKDLLQIVNLFKNTVSNVNLSDYSEPQIKAWINYVNFDQWGKTLKENYTLVALLDDVIVGFVDMNKDGYLDHLYVHKDFQRQRIATILCNQLETDYPMKKITTNASITAKPFFEKRGFKSLKKQEVIRNNITLINYVMEANR